MAGVGEGRRMVDGGMMERGSGRETIARDDALNLSRNTKSMPYKSGEVVPPTAASLMAPS